MLKKIALVLFIALIIIQFIHPAKNLATERTGQHIEAIYPVSADVQAVLSRACYDCHSDSTRYPWYNKVQPIAWWLANHVDEGKGELNFSQFGTYNAKKQKHKLDEVSEMVREGHMPLDSYKWLHSDAELTPEEIKLVSDWADGLRARITE